LESSVRPLIDRGVDFMPARANADEKRKGIHPSVNGSSSKALKAGCVALALAILPVFALAAVLCCGTPEPESTPDLRMQASYVPFAPIFINGDSDFSAKAIDNGWPGDGTEEDPFVIDGYSIDAGGDKQAIYVGNTTVHFVISGCYLGGASESGIHLLNVENGTMTDNQCMSNVWNGIALVNSESCNVSSNSCEGGHYGILLLSSDSNFVAENNCTKNGDGIVLRTSHDNVVLGNKCNLSDGDGTSDFGDGIRLFESEGNDLIENDCSMNERYQIRLEYSNDCTVCSGVFVVDTYANQHGLSLYHSGGNSVSDLVISSAGVSLEDSEMNELVSCTFTGVTLTRSNSNTVTGCNGQVTLSSSSSWNTVTWNNCSYHLRGIGLDDAHNNTISNNTCTGMIEGISLYRSHDNILADNDARYNTGGYRSMSDRPRGYGIIMEESNRNLVLRNDCSYAMIGLSWWASGICMFSCGWNTLSENIVTHSEGTGIYVNGWSNTVRNNTVEHNGLSSIDVVDRSGICLASATGSSVQYNLIRYNCVDGLKVDGDQNHVADNRIESNLGFGILSNTQTSANIYERNAMVNDGISPDSEYEAVDITNTVNGRTVQHLRSVSGGSVPVGAGQVILYMCTGVTVSDQNLSMADVGLMVIESTDCTIRDNTCIFEMIGVSLTGSSHNTIVSNNLSANSVNGLLLSGDYNDVSENGVFDNIGYGMSVTGIGNMFWNNTFARNNGAGSVYDPQHRQASSGSSNFWNKSSYGNYWGDWTTPDLDYDGIVDQPYVLAGGGTDYYPRVAPTVYIPPAPIPEFGPLTALFVVIVSVIAISVIARRERP